MVQEVAVGVKAVEDGAEAIVDVPSLRMQHSKADMFHRQPHYLAEASKQINNQLRGTPQTQSNNSTTAIIVTREGLT